MNPDTGIAAVAHVIQLAVAPVFLLSGIGAILAVMTNRLARVIDRARALEQQRLAGSAEDHMRIDAQLATLARRAALASRAIALCTLTALFICAVVATLFLGVFFGFDASIWVALLFIAAMVAVFAGLVFFLREIFLATSSLGIGTYLEPRG
jgi:Protein of unknown function (DUF2721)